ncbi:ras-related protein Rab-34 isoform X3 [Scleropages formosus]|uniref:ras-related protein Rab-34 isoform X3 n=1 Tax=Scleropages formosus TaxID=113540 RepID=UPI0010FAB62F|nr:ras-related protein Rab-34 isoform X3 [Scleropages formosus]
MSVLPPVRKDRIITELPRCFTKEAALHTNETFHAKVKTACQDQQMGGAGFTVCKVIVVGDVAVGKTCLIHRWDTAGQERFKCIASTYYRGAQAMIIVFDVNNAASLVHVRQWLEDAMKENDPSSVLLFLVGTKKDLRSPDRFSEIEQEAIKLSAEIRAEYWAVSALSGESVREFFFRVASLTFEASVLAELEKTESRRTEGIVREWPLRNTDRIASRHPIAFLFGFRHVDLHWAVITAFFKCFNGY